MPLIPFPAALRLNLRPDFRVLFVFAALAIAVASTAQAQVGAVPTLPEVTITAARFGLRESLPVDESGRPEWTSQRRFGNTRVYIQDSPGEVSLEQWWRLQKNGDGTTENLFEEEIEIGLPHRFQLDLYENWAADEHRRLRHKNVSFELRWALADWGRIPLNPTLYVEYKAAPNVRDDFLETKLLLGADLNPRLHWGFNASREWQLGGERSVEYELTQGISYSLIDQALGAGLEMEYGDVTVAGMRGRPQRRFLIGPSIQWRPGPNTHIDLVAEAGATRSPYVQSFVIFGIDFGRVAGERHYIPASMRGN